MKEWTTRKKRLAGVAAAVVIGFLLYMGATRLWAVVLEMHHM
jgi:hypothetical protein